MRKGFASLALLVQEVLKRDPLCGHYLSCPRAFRGDLIKVIWHVGQAASLYVRRLEKGPAFLAIAGGWDRDDHAGADGLFIVRH